MRDLSECKCKSWTGSLCLLLLCIVAQSAFRSKVLVLSHALTSAVINTISHTSTDALPLYPQRRKESDASDDSVSSDHWMLTQADRAEEEESHQNCPEQPAVNRVCSSASPSHQEPTVQKNSPVEVQEGTVESGFHF